jgi:hypothetical protein
MQNYVYTPRLHIYALFCVHICIYIYIHVCICTYIIYNTRIWWEDLRKGDYLKDPNVWEDNIKTGFQEVGWGHGLD